MQIKEILRFLKYEDIKITFYGEETDEITGFSSMYKYKDKTITWCKKLEPALMTYSLLYCLKRRIETSKIIL